MCNMQAPRISIVPRKPYPSSMYSIRNGRMNDPAAVPERQNALAMPLRLSKYRAVNITPGVVDKPTPIPVRTPKVRKRS